MKTPVVFKDRNTQKLCRETIAGETGLRFLYQSLPGNLVLEFVGKRGFLSKLMGYYQNTRISRRDIPGFVKALGIDLGEAEKTMDEFTSFNDFFSRKLKPLARPIIPEPDRLCLPADGRILALPVLQEQTCLAVKGARLDLKHLLLDSALHSTHLGGTAIIVRLSPMDYHRFHFCFAGTPSQSRRISGHFYSVNPIALAEKPGLWSKNERQITILDNSRLGKILHIEVGATFVGKILQTFLPGSSVTKGQEKGTFLFGASTVILIFEPGKITLDPDLIENTQAGYETLDFMGSGFATCL